MCLKIIGPKLVAHKMKIKLHIRKQYYVPYPKKQTKTKKSMGAVNGPVAPQINKAVMCIFAE